MANAVKKKYYCQDLPHLLKDMQELAESTIQGLKNIWTSYAEEETQFLDACRRHTTSLTSTISLVDPVCDADPRGPQFWFSLRQQHEGSSEVTAPPLPLAPQPPDFVFVPSIMWREKAEVGKDDASRTYMVNLVRTLRKQLEKLDKEVAVRSRGVEGMKVLMEAYTKNPNQGDAFDVKENILEINRELTLLMNARTKLKTNIDFIVASVGDECPSDRFHTFKTAAFAIPTSCDQCRQTIWGVAKTGLWCTQCGFSAHVKCELKIAPTCSGVRIARSRAGRPKSMCSHRTSTPTISRPVHLESVSAQSRGWIVSSCII
ncbi:hypothetical protein BC829DRAFT_298079 [Chytridium lagenaria]|nr:hypothetical protein BC829DRAFT_298079 [Chytridium lagenaria]